MQTVNIHEAKTQLSRYVDQVSLGEEITIARAGKPIARLVPLVAEQQTRRLGLGKAKFNLPANFDGANAEIETMFEIGL